MIVHVFVISLIAVPNITGLDDPVAESCKKWEHRFRVIIDAPRSLPADAVLSDWSWQGNQLFSSEPTGQENRILVFQITRDSVTQMGRSFKDGRFPVILPGNRLVYLEGGRNLILSSIAVDDDKWRRFPIDTIGSVGEVVASGHRLFFYGVDTSLPDQLPTMAVFDPINSNISVLGKGYYPRSRDGRTVFFVNPADGYSLMKDRLLGSGKLAGHPELVSHGPIYFPQVVAGRPILVIQRGLDNRRVDVISDDGITLRTLSPLSRNGTYPLVSPSGSFVAFATYALENEELLHVNIVSLDGDILYSEQAGTPWINAAFRWAADGDRLAVVVRNEAEGRALEIVDCARGKE